MQPIPPDDPCLTDDGTASDIKVNYHHDVDFEQELQLRRDFAHSWTGRGGYFITFNGMPISWRSRLQGTVSLSSAQAEVYALADGVIEATHLKYVAEELGLREQNISMPVHCDSQAAIGFQKNGGGGKVPSA